MGRKKSGLLTAMTKRANRRAKNAMRQGFYEMMWGEEPPKGKKKVNKDDGTIF